MAFTGGIDWIIKNNTFESNGGNAPNYAIDFEDGWELMQDILVKGNKFINNNNDVVICAGNNISFENNDFKKGVYFYPRTTNYKFINNIVDGGIVTLQVKLSSCEVSGNTYKNNSTINAGASSNLEYKYNLINETIINSSVNIASGNKLVNSSIYNSTKGYRIVGYLENCTIETSGKLEAVNLILNQCTILNSSMNLQNSINIQNYEISNSYFETYGNTSSIYFKSSNIINSQLSFNTWAAACDVTFDSCIITIDSELSFIRISAGKTKLLSIIDNQIKNTSTNALIYMYDTSYSIPNGNVVLSNNNITQSIASYVFDGVIIKSGIVNFTNKNNTIISTTLLNPIYINNSYLNIIN